MHPMTDEKKKELEKKMQQDMAGSAERTWVNYYRHRTALIECVKLLNDTAIDPAARIKECLRVMNASLDKETTPEN